MSEYGFVDLDSVIVTPSFDRVEHQQQFDKRNIKITKPLGLLKQIQVLLWVPEIFAEKKRGESK